MDVQTFEDVCGSALFAYRLFGGQER